MPTLGLRWQVNPPGTNAGWGKLREPDDKYF
jgi:hypothetical protein